MQGSVLVIESIIRSSCRIRLTNSCESFSARIFERGGRRDAYEPCALPPASCKAGGWRRRGGGWRRGRRHEAGGTRLETRVSCRACSIPSRGLNLGGFTRAPSPPQNCALPSKRLVSRPQGAVHLLGGTAHAPSAASTSRSTSSSARGGASRATVMNIGHEVDRTHPLSPAWSDARRPARAPYIFLGSWRATLSFPLL